MSVAFLLVSGYEAAGAMETPVLGIPLHRYFSASLCYFSVCINHCYGLRLSHLRAYYY